MSAEPAPRLWRVSVPGLLPLPNDWFRMPLKSRLRHKRQWRDWTVFALLAGQVPSLGRARVTFVRWSSREPDSDGLVASFKHVRDALALAHVIDDDGRGYLDAVYRHGHCARDAARIELTIEEWV